MHYRIPIPEYIFSKIPSKYIIQKFTTSGGERRNHG